MNRILERREFLGWKLGLERMHRLCTLLGMPQNRFASVHVVGTNGKTSVARMTAALMEAHGVRAGAYLSPHINEWRERVVIGGGPIPQGDFDAAVTRAEQAAATADRAAGEEGPVTQYELLTAAAFVAFAAARVEAVAVEAGLGGRLDATNVIPSKATVLTSVGLDHTEWLGDTLEEIAAEKLAVLRDHTALITGALPAQVEPVADRFAAERHARRVRVPADEAGSYPERNFALARAAASVLLGRQLDPAGVSSAQEHLDNPGRAQVIQGDPPVILDAAHNPQGAEALARLLPALAGGRPVIGCVAVLEDKDAAGVLSALAPACALVVCTEVPAEAMAATGRPGARSRPAAQLTALAREAGASAEAVPDAGRAWERAREIARERGAVALAAGSHYLLKSVWTERPGESS